MVKGVVQTQEAMDAKPADPGFPSTHQDMVPDTVPSHGFTGFGVPRTKQPVAGEVAAKKEEGENNE